MAFKLNQEINGVHFDIDFQDRICIIKGYSGTGKSFMFNVMKDYCVLNNIKVIKIDYSILQIFDEGNIVSACQDKDLIIFNSLLVG